MLGRTDPIPSNNGHIGSWVVTLWFVSRRGNWWVSTRTQAIWQPLWWASLHESLQCLLELFCRLVLIHFVLIVVFFVGMAINFRDGHKFFFGMAVTELPLRVNHILVDWGEKWPFEASGPKQSYSLIYAHSIGWIVAFPGLQRHYYSLETRSKKWWIYGSCFRRENMWKGPWRLTPSEIWSRLWIFNVINCLPYNVSKFITYWARVRFPYKTHSVMKRDFLTKTGQCKGNLQPSPSRQ